jgi:hypothetical protein
MTLTKKMVLERAEAMFAKVPAARVLHVVRYAYCVATPAAEHVIFAINPAEDPGQAPGYVQVRNETAAGTRAGDWRALVYVSIGNQSQWYVACFQEIQNQKDWYE